MGAKIINKRTLNALVKSVAKEVVNQQPRYHRGKHFMKMQPLTCYSSRISSNGHSYQMGLMGEFALYKNGYGRTCIDIDDLSIGVWRDGSGIESDIFANEIIKDWELFDNVHTALDREAGKIKNI